MLDMASFVNYGRDIMNIRKLKLFYATATYLNMTKVSKEFYISQPSVSQAIHEIEEELGVNLFDRIGKKLYLTSEGEEYLKYVRRILNLYEEGIERINQISNKEIGKIRIGASTTIGIYILPDIIKEFVEEHKGIEISLIIENTSNIERLILENKIDFAYVEGSVHSEELIVNTMWKDELIFISSKNHPWGNNKTIKPKDIEKEKFIMREEGSGTREIIEGYFKNNNIKYRLFMELGNTEAIMKSVEANLGIGCVSEKCAMERIKQGSLQQIKLEESKIERDLYLIYHKDKFINNNLKEFINFSYK